MPTNITNKWRRWLLRRLQVAADLEEHGIDPKEKGTYNFRHSAISSFLDSGGDIYVASQFYGTGVKMIERRYGHPNIERLHEKFRAFTSAHPVPMPSVVNSNPPADAAANDTPRPRQKAVTRAR